MKKTIILFILSLGLAFNALSQFVHPGGLHTLDDLDRMKTKVAEGAHPWIEGWNALIQDPWAQSSYTAAPLANMGGNRQRASRDAHAAYLNAIRGYISNSTEHIDAAIKICNAWSSTVNQVPTGNDIPGLSGIPIAEFAMVGELLRMYVPERWSTEDFNRFKKMMIDYLYPVCNDFLVNHAGRCADYFWANWDAANIMALLGIGVLCDNQEIFDEGVEYFKNGEGAGSIKNAVVHMHPGNLGQWQETGRDQSHALLGVGFLATVCEIAWKQGIDLYGYDNNRLLAGAEYVAQYNLWKDVPYEFYNSCQQVNNKWPAINARGSFHDRPVYEMIYNHYVVRQGLQASNSKLMAEIMRPERGSNDHFGYGTLTFTLNPSDFPVHPIPPVPSGLTAAPSSGRVFLKWNSPVGNTIRGYRVQRSINSSGPYETIASWEGNTSALYTDNNVTNGVTYYYKVAGINQAGTSENSVEANATPQGTGALPLGWNIIKIGQQSNVTASFAEVSGGTFIVSGIGANLGGTSDDVAFAYTIAEGDNAIVGRINGIGGSLLKTGLMIRENLSPDSKAVTMTLGDAGWRFARMGQRTSKNANMQFTLGNAYTWQPAWFKLERVGDIVTAYESPDGSTWFKVGESNIALADNYYIGLVISSGNATATNTTTFDHVSFENPTFSGELLAHYTFDNTLEDVSDNDFHASSSASLFVEGKMNLAIDLKGTDQYIELPSGILDDADEMTLCTWIYFKAKAKYQVFDIGSSDAGMSLTADLTAGTLNFTIQQNSTVQQVEANVALPINKWLHIAIVLEAGKGILYVNGKQVGSENNISLNPSDLNLTGKGFIGVSRDKTIYLEGLIDDFRIYNTALNAYFIGDLSDAPVGAAPLIKSYGIINLLLGDEYQLDVEADYFPTGFEAFGLPEGFELEPTQGAISGIAQETGIFNVIITASNLYGSSSSEVVFMIRSESDDGLIAHYRQELNTLDASGNNFHGELINGNDYAAARLGFGIELDGIDDHFLLPPGIVSTLTNFTIATWVRITGTEKVWSRIFDFGTGTNFYMFLTPNSGNGTIRFAIKNGGNEQVVQHNQPLSAGVWRHVAVTLSGNTCRLYVNGKEVASNPNVTIKPSDIGVSYNNYIGRSQFPDPYFQGIVDDFRIYDRGLSAKEIEDLYLYDEKIDNGIYKISALHSGKVMGVQANSIQGAGIAQFEYDTCKCQVWELFRIGNSLYNLASLETGLCLQAIDDFHENEASLQLQPKNTGLTEQRFVLSKVDSDHFLISSEQLQLAITIKDGLETDGETVQLNEYIGGAHQQWKFSKVNIEDFILSTKTDIIEPWVKVYPNPVAGLLTIHSDKQGEGTLWIRDLRGHEVIAQKFSDNIINVDIRGIAPGIYILSLHSGMDKVHVKFIKE